jgi:hypothetical protein
MTISGVEPAKRGFRFVTWGLAALGLTATLAAPLALRASNVLAEQVAVADVNTANAAGATGEKAPAAYSIKVVKQGPDRLKLKGLVATEEDHKALLGLVKASFPSADVNDRIKISDQSKGDMKLGGISFALKALSYLQTGSAQIDEQGVVLSGGAETSTVYSEFKNFIASPPTGVVLRSDQVTPPKSTFSLRAEVGDGRVKLTGAVPEGSEKKALEASVHKMFSGLEIVDHTSVAKAAPDSWLDAAMHSLRVLKLLDFGFVQLADHTIQLDGHTSDEGKLEKIDSLADDYPTGFALESKVSAPTQASMLAFPQAVAAERPKTAYDAPIVEAQPAGEMPQQPQP